MFDFLKTKSVDGVDPRADLAQRRKELDALGDERQRLKTAAEQAEDQHQRAYDEYARLFTVEGAADATDEDVLRAKQAYRAARDVEAAAAAAYAAHLQTHSDLGAQQQLLAAEERYLDSVDKITARRAKLAKMVSLAMELMDLNREIEQQQQEAFSQFKGSEVLPDGRQIQRGLGFRDCAFPGGVLEATVTPLGPRSVLWDHLLYNVGLECPELLSAELREQVQRKIDRDRERGVRYHFSLINWATAPHRILGS